MSDDDDDADEEKKNNKNKTSLASLNMNDELLMLAKQ